MEKLKIGFSVGLAAGLLLMLAFTFASSNILQSTTVQNTATSYSGLLQVSDLNGNVLGSVAGHDWGGFSLYEVKNWTVQVENIGQDVLNVVWGQSGLDTNYWQVSAEYGSNLSEITNLFPATDLTTLNSSIASSSPTINMGTAIIPARSTSVTVSYSLPYVPTVNQIQVTSLDGFNGSVWVQNITPTTFEIHIDMERTPDGLNHAFGWFIPTTNSASQSSTSEPFSIQVQPAQSIYVCFELEKIASTINAASFELQILSID